MPRWFVREVKAALLLAHCEEVRRSFSRRRRRCAWWWPGKVGVGDPTWEWPERPAALPGRGFFAGG